VALTTTVAGASSNSYLTVADADALANQHLGREARSWLAASVTDKERALIQAAQDIDTLVGSVVRYDDLQALTFPLSTDVDAITLMPYIEPRVKRAQYAQAAYLIHNADLISDAATRRARGLFSFSEDNMSGSLTVDGSIGLISPAAQAIMASLTQRTRATLRSVPISTRTWPLD